MAGRVRQRQGFAGIAGFGFTAWCSERRQNLRVGTDGSDGIGSSRIVPRGDNGSEPNLFLLFARPFQQFGYVMPLRERQARIHADGRPSNSPTSDTGYALSGSLLSRQREQDTGRHRSSAGWDGDWFVVIVTAERRTTTERRDFRARAIGSRLGELRPDIWMRPANIEIPYDLPDCLVTRGPLEGADGTATAGQLWSLTRIDGESRLRRTDLDRAAEQLDRDGQRRPGPGVRCARPRAAPPPRRAAAPLRTALPNGRRRTAGTLRRRRAALTRGAAGVSPQLTGSVQAGGELAAVVGGAGVVLTHHLEQVDEPLTSLVVGLHRGEQRLELLIDVAADTGAPRSGAGGDAAGLGRLGDPGEDLQCLVPLGPRRRAARRARSRRRLSGSASAPGARTPRHRWRRGRRWRPPPRWAAGGRRTPAPRARAGPRRSRRRSCRPSARTRRGSTAPGRPGTPPGSRRR